MQKIIIVNDFDYVQGGASKVAITTAELFHKNGWDVTFFSGATKNDKYQFKTVTLDDIEISKGQNKFKNIKNTIAYKKLKEIIDPNEQYIVFVHGWTKVLSSTVFKVGRLPNVKLYITLHDYFLACPNGGFFNFKKCSICHKKPMSINCILTNCDSRNYFVKLYRVIRTFYQNHVINVKKYIYGYIHISEFEKNILTSIPEQKSYMVRNLIDYFNYDQRIEVEKNNALVFIGRLDKEKGIEVACEAAHRAKVKFYIIGDGNMRTVLEERYKEDPNLIFLGWQDKNTMLKYLLNVRALIYPSFWYETATLSTAEVMGLGIPCIVPSTCAAIDFVNSKNGYIVDIMNLDDVVNKINIMIADKNIIDKSFNCLETVKNLFDNDNYYNKLNSIFTEK